MNNTLRNMIVLAAFVNTVAISGADVAPTHNHDNMSMTPMSQDMMMQNQMMQKSSQFKGIEVNKGSVSTYVKDGKTHIKWSDDFTVPNSPAPHWQIVDEKGTVYLLQRLTIAGDKQNRDIILPSHIKSIKKVQIWCSFAEVNLGEATFAKAVKAN
jgi:hypothetical protein